MKTKELNREETQDTKENRGEERNDWQIVPPTMGVLMGRGGKWAKRSCLGLGNEEEKGVDDERDDARNPGRGKREGKMSVKILRTESGRANAPPRHTDGRVESPDQGKEDTSHVSAGANEARHDSVVVAVAVGDKREVGAVGHLVRERNRRDKQHRSRERGRGSVLEPETEADAKNALQDSETERPVDLGLDAPPSVEEVAENPAQGPSDEVQETEEGSEVTGVDMRDRLVRLEDVGTEVAVDGEF